MVDTHKRVVSVIHY